MSKMSLIVPIFPQYRLLIHVDGIEQYPVETVVEYQKGMFLTIILVAFQ